MAILPANVLVSDNASQWLKIGVPLVLQQDLMTARGFIPGVTRDDSTAAQAKATEVIRTTVESRPNGLHIESKLFDLKTQKVLQAKSVEGVSMPKIIDSINSLAKMFDANASPYPTGTLQALQSYIGAATTPNREQRAQLLQQAFKADPDFALPYIALLEMTGPNPPLLNQAKSHRSKFSSYDRAKFDLAVSRVTGSPSSEQIKQAKETLKFAPNDLDVLASLGMSQFIEGDELAGEATLRRAISLNPANAALQVQLGRGLMRARKLKEADAAFSAIENNTAVLPELATCVLLEGDTARANSIADKLFASVQSQELRPLLAASWQFMSGQHQKGVDMLLKGNFTSPNAQAVALSEAAVWQTMMHDYSGAQASLRRASLANGQAISFPAVAALLLDRSSASIDWQKRVQASPLPENAKEPLLAYGLFLRESYAEAAEKWQETLDKSHGSDVRARAMLASSLDRAGKNAEAQKVKVVPFVPEFGDLYAAISFAEMRRLLKL